MNYKGIANALIFDTETTTSNKGNFADKRNKLVVGGFHYGDHKVYTRFWYDDPDYVYHIQKCIDAHEWIVGFNLKFDLHWLLNVGIKFRDYHKLWDCQLFEYSKYYQRKKYISLQDTCESYGLQGKIDVIKEEYWNKGIDTDQIPRDILGEYLDRDVQETYEVLQHQLAYRPDGMRPSWFNTFRRDCSDLWTVIEMERAGSLLDVQGVKCELEQQQMRKQELVQSVLSVVPTELHSSFNLNSNDDLSCLLYGGTIVEEQRIPVGVFKSGARVGQPRYSVFKYEHVLPKRFEPARNSEMKKAGYWSTAEDNLLKIKANKKDRQLLDNIIEIGKIEKLIGSYLIKMPKMIEDYHWPAGYLHGQYSHGITMTSRLASDKPNMQNMGPTMKKYIISRFV